MKIYRNIADIITGLRICGTIALLFLVPLSPVFYIVYTLTGLTDVLDGWAARKSGAASDFGAKLDSVADLIFYAVMLIKLLPVMYEMLPHAIWWFLGAVLFIRVCAYAAAAVKYRRFASLHTYLNKATGFAVFMIPYYLALPCHTVLCFAACTIGAVSASEELILHIMAKEYNAKTKGIFFRGKAEE